MNFIKRMQAENAALKAALTAVRVESTNFRADLGGAKFTGTESDGTRKDWMSTSDIHTRLLQVERIVTDAFMNVEG